MKLKPLLLVQWGLFVLYRNVAFCRTNNIPLPLSKGEFAECGLVVFPH